LARFIAQGECVVQYAIFEALHMIAGTIIIRSPVGRKSQTKSLQFADHQPVLQVLDAATYSVSVKAVRGGEQSTLDQKRSTGFCASLFFQDNRAEFTTTEYPDLMTTYKYTIEHFGPVTSYGTYRQLLYFDTLCGAVDKAPGRGELP
jgi:hypothetical protein